ncbi:MAG TPA: DUF58 domain-containing protein, partial [Oscillatoriaceae cyanobacterium]
TAYVLFLVVGGVFIAAYQTQTAWLYLLGSLGTALAIASWAMAWRQLHGVRVVAQPVAPVSQGDPATLHLHLTKRGRGVSRHVQVLVGPRPQPWWLSLWRAQLVPASAHAALAERLSADAPAELRLPLETPRRGELPLPQAILQSAYPMGLVIDIWRVRLPGTYLVYPAAAPLRRLAWLPSGDAGMQASRATRAGAGLLLRGVREHRSGDGLREIHWKSSARAGRLIAKESEREQDAELVLFLDLRRGIHTEASLEHLVAIASSLVVHMRQAGRMVRLMTQREATPPPAGALEDAELAWLARARAIAESAPVGPPGAVLLSSVPVPEWPAWASHFVYAPETADTAEASLVCPVGTPLMALEGA